MMKRISVRILRFALECAISDRLAFAEATENCEDNICAGAKHDVARFREIKRALFGDGYTFIDPDAI